MFQIGDADIDHAYWGSPESIGDWMERPTWTVHCGNPGSDIAADFASGMASASLLLKNDDPEFSASLLDHAKQLLEFAQNCRGLYSDVVANGNTYTSSDDKDELTFAAAWLYRASGEQQYLDKARQWYDEFYIQWEGSKLNWDDKRLGVQALMAELTEEDRYRGDLETTLNNILDNSQYSPRGQLFLDKWGSLRHSSNVAAMATIATKLGINPGKFKPAAEQQIGYILGDTGRSFVVGYGTNPPTHVHHRGASCTGGYCCDPSCGDPNPNIITGALAGGPAAPDDHYHDDRADYVMNEVALDYNAGFQMAIAGLNSM